jgi:hypothetical protein
LETNLHVVLLRDVPTTELRVYAMLAMVELATIVQGVVLKRSKIVLEILSVALVLFRARATRTSLKHALQLPIDCAQTVPSPTLICPCNRVIHVTILNA